MDFQNPHKPQEIGVTQTLDLSGKLLIAMPDMGDPRFDRSVILICAHSDEGAMGLMVNRATGELRLSNLTEQLDIETDPDYGQQPVCIGGPVEQERGFVLHTRDYTSAISTMPVTDDIAMTGTLDVLEDLAEGRGPHRARILLGYCGWGPGQLENEIAHNAWLVGDASFDLVFETADLRKWESALEHQKISALTLSSTAGRA